MKICKNCGKEFTPKMNRHVVCEPKCNTRKMTQKVKEKRLQNIKDVKAQYKKLELFTDKRADIKVKLVDVLIDNERVSTTRAFNNIKKPLDKVKNETKRIQYSICSANEMVVLIGHFEDKYMNTANTLYFQSVQMYTRIMKKIYKYAKEKHERVN